MRRRSLRPLLDALCLLAAFVLALLVRFRFETMAFDPRTCRANAVRFAPERFRQEFSTFVEQEWQAFCKLKEVESWPIAGWVLSLTLSVLGQVRWLRGCRNHAPGLEQ